VDWVIDKWSTLANFQIVAEISKPRGSQTLDLQVALPKQANSKRLTPIILTGDQMILKISSKLFLSRRFKDRFNIGTDIQIANIAELCGNS